jgi:hypothetical protein
VLTSWSVNVDTHQHTLWTLARPHDSPCNRGTSISRWPCKGTQAPSSCCCEGDCGPVAGKLMHGSCVCEARSLVCDVPPMKGSVNPRRPLTERPLPASSTASRNNLSPFPSLKHRYATHFTDTRCYRQSPHLLPARTHSHEAPCSCFLTKDGPLAVNARLSRSNYHVLNCAECTTAAAALKSDMAVSSSEPRTHDEPNRL